jgi:hypothetical protein
VGAAEFTLGLPPLPPTGSRAHRVLPLTRQARRRPLPEREYRSAGTDHESRARPGEEPRSARALAGAKPFQSLLR